MTDPAVSAVLEAFDAAQAAHLPPVICYRAGIEAWRRAHPDQRPEYARKKAVDVILTAKVSLRVDVIAARPGWPGRGPSSGEN
jgi:hypothetical protein